MKKRNVNTEIGVFLKTNLRDDARMIRGRNYVGVLTRDTTGSEMEIGDEHFTFKEEYPSAPIKHNPVMYRGVHISSITQNDNGHLLIHSRQVRISEGFNPEDFANEFCNELLNALKCLVEK